MDADIENERAESSEDRLLTPEEVADRLRIARATLDTWRCKSRREPLAFVKLGGRVFYRPADVSAFVENHLQAA